MSEIEHNFFGKSKDPCPDRLRVLRGGPSSRDPYLAHDEGEIALETLRRVLHRERARRRRRALRELARSLRQPLKT